MKIAFEADETSPGLMPEIRSKIDWTSWVVQVPRKEKLNASKQQIEKLIIRIRHSIVKSSKCWHDEV